MVKRLMIKPHLHSMAVNPWDLMHPLGSYSGMIMLGKKNNISGSPKRYLHIEIYTYVIYVIYIYVYIYIYISNIHIHCYMIYIYIYIYIYISYHMYNHIISCIKYQANAGWKLCSSSAAHGVSIAAMPLAPWISPWRFHGFFPWDSTIGNVFIGTWEYRNGWDKVVVTGTMEIYMTFPSYWEWNNHPNWRTFFSEGCQPAKKTNQMGIFHGI